MSYKLPAKFKLSSSLRLACVGALCGVLVGCVTLNDAYRPEELANPSKVGCIYLPAAVTVVGKDGLFNQVWERRLEAGPYFSEKEDEEGIYYRGLRGSYFEARPAPATPDQPVGAYANTPMHYDGGFWMPRDPQAMPRFYHYVTQSKSVKHEPAQQDCSTLIYVRDPETLGINAMGLTAADALGGLAYRAAGATSVSYGQAAINGAVLGFVAASLINMDVGKVSVSPPVEDAAFATTLRAQAAKAVPLKEMPPVGKPVGVAAGSQ